VSKLDWDRARKEQLAKHHGVEPYRSDGDIESKFSRRGFENAVNAGQVPFEEFLNDAAVRLGRMTRCAVCSTAVSPAKLARHMRRKHGL
jgi:hypothetical protein